MTIKDNKFKPLDFGPVEDTTHHIIKVVGVGGGGCNAVRNMYNEGIEDVTFAVLNTDSKSLSKSPVPVKVPLGQSGHGAGAKPEVGKEEAEYSKEMIERLFDDGTQMVFVTAGMGGGTGTGAGPVVAQVAKEKGLLTIGVVTIPFYFEKKNKILKALKGVEEMRKNVDALLIVNNERICDIYGETEIPVKEAFKRADTILSNAVKSISELITIEGDINLDFKDVETTMRSGGGAIMAIGRASGERRVTKAFLNALDSPLLYGSDIGKAKRILFNIYTSEEHPIFVSELQQIDDFMDELNPNIDVIWGLSTEEDLGEDAKVAILATGLDEEFGQSPSDSSAKKDDKFFLGMIDRLYKGNSKQPAAASQQNAESVPLSITNLQEQPAAPIEESGLSPEAQIAEEETNSPIIITTKREETPSYNISEDNYSDPKDIEEEQGEVEQREEAIQITNPDKELSLVERFKRRIKLITDDLLKE